MSRALKFALMAFAFVLLPAAGRSLQAKPSHTLASALSSPPAATHGGLPAGPRHYLFTTDYFEFDAAGAFLDKTRVWGRYTQGLPGHKVRWDDVQIANSKAIDQPYSGGTAQSYMNGFTYKSADLAHSFAKGFFVGFPDSLETKSLVWDVGMFEMFAGDRSRLKLNVPLRLRLPDTAFPEGGTFKNKQPTLTWIGITRVNRKICALIQYQAFFNPITLVQTGAFLRGLSSYQGLIAVAVDTNEIEHATLQEDVIATVTPQGAPKVGGGLIAHTVRVGELRLLGN